MMKILKVTLGALTAFNILLLLSIAYWFVFTNGAPPFVAGQPVSDVACVLITLTLASGGAFAVMMDEEL